MDAHVIVLGPVEHQPQARPVVREALVMNRPAKVRVATTAPLPPRERGEKGLPLGGKAQVPEGEEMKTGGPKTIANHPARLPVKTRVRLVGFRIIGGAIVRTRRGVLFAVRTHTRSLIAGPKTGEEIFEKTGLPVTSRGRRLRNAGGVPERAGARILRGAFKAPEDPHGKGKEGR